MDEDSEPTVGPKFFEEMVETVGVAIYDSSGAFRCVNEAYASLLGADREALVGTLLWDVVARFDKARFADYWNSTRARPESRRPTASGRGPPSRSAPSRPGVTSM
jgi:PAS domain S-box-containing protein